MRHHSAAVAIVTLLCAVAPGAAAQTIRGTVIEEGTARPLSGVLIGIWGPGMPRGDTAYVLTTPRGEFGARLLEAGEYTLTFKRIGVTRRVLTVRLGLGETRRLNVTLSPVPTRLAPTAVLASGLCVDRPQELAQLSAFWEEARTVLRSAQVTDRGEGARGLVTQYVRVLQPVKVADGSLLPILDDDRRVTDGVWTQPWRSQNAEWLSTAGFWGTYGGDSAIYHGPDAAALLAPEFLRDYCFGLNEGRNENAGLTGITFRPRRTWMQRRIEGTLWLDSFNFELRFVQFRYLNLPGENFTQYLGGEVHFVKHDTGGWLVQRWFLRMPEYGAGGRTVIGINEEGGSLYSDDLETRERRATVSGIVRDSLGAPMAGASVTLPGTPFAATSDLNGAFRFDSVVPGAHVVHVTSPAYAELGLPTGATPFNLKSGAEYPATVRAHTNAELLEKICGRGRVEKDDASVRVRLVSAEDGKPLPGLVASIRWDDARRRVPITVLDRGTAGHYSSLGLSPEFGKAQRSDSLGFLSFCGVPSNRPLFVYVDRPVSDVPTELSDPIVNWTLPPGTLETRSVRVRRER